MKLKYHITIALVYICHSLFAQESGLSLDPQSKVYLADYVKELAIGAEHWVAEPNVTTAKKKLDSLLNSYDTIKDNLVKRIIVLQSEHDLAKLKEILFKYENDRSALLEKLLLWKNYKPESNLKDFILDLDSFVKNIMTITKDLKDNKSYDDPLTVLLAQDALETSIDPQAKEIIKKLN
ncbi:MAG: hypothetical protein AAGF85_21210 [Bacteroidota bacterium]